MLASIVLKNDKVKKRPVSAGRFCFEQGVSFFIAVAINEIKESE